jgi:hypothetical protein
MITYHIFIPLFSKGTLGFQKWTFLKMSKIQKPFSDLGKKSEKNRKWTFLFECFIVTDFTSKRFQIIIFKSFSITV